MELILLFGVVFLIFVAVKMATTGQSFGEAAKNTASENLEISKRNLTTAGKIVATTVKAVAKK